VSVPESTKTANRMSPSPRYFFATWYFMSTVVCCSARRKLTSALSRTCTTISNDAIVKSFRSLGSPSQRTGTTWAPTRTTSVTRRAEPSMPISVVE